MWLKEYLFDLLQCPMLHVSVLFTLPISLFSSLLVSTLSVLASASFAQSTQCVHLFSFHIVFLALAERPVSHDPTWRSSPSLRSRLSPYTHALSPMALASFSRPRRLFGQLYPSFSGSSISVLFVSHCFNTCSAIEKIFERFVSQRIVELARDARWRSGIFVNGPCSFAWAPFADRESHLGEDREPRGCHVDDLCAMRMPCSWKEAHWRSL